MTLYDTNGREFTICDPNEAKKFYARQLERELRFDLHNIKERIKARREKLAELRAVRAQISRECEQDDAQAAE